MEKIRKSEMHYNYYGYNEKQTTENVNLNE